jgi:hypothetical protein
MGPLVTDIATILNGDGVGTLGTDIFASKEPDSPDNCITIYNTGGLPDECLSVTSDDEMCTFQVRVRNNSYVNGYVVMDAIRDSIEKSKYNIITDSAGSTYYSIWSTSLPLDLQRDTTNRSIVTQNYACIRYFE